MVRKVSPTTVDGSSAQDAALAKRHATVRAVRRRERLIAVATVVLYMLCGFFFYTFVSPQRKDPPGSGGSGAPAASAQPPGGSGGGAPRPAWTFVDCIYFAVTTTTTVGYGDLVPTDAGAKIFTIFFAFLGVGLVGLAMGLIAQMFVEWQQAAGRRAARRMLEETLRATERARSSLKIAKNRAMAPRATPRAMGGGGGGGGGGGVGSSSSSSTSPSSSSSSSSSWSGVARRWLCGGGGGGGDDSDEMKVAYGVRVLRVLAPLVAYVLLGWPTLGRLEGWGFVDSVYVASVSITSVGFGDLSPQTQAGRGFAIFYLPVGVALAMNTIGQMAHLHRRQHVTKRVPLRTLLQMDTDGNGSIDEAEYLVHMLVAMKKVDKSTLDLLLLQFSSLDASGTGVLKISDLTATAHQQGGGQEGGRGAGGLMTRSNSDGGLLRGASAAHDESSDDDDDDDEAIGAVGGGGGPAAREDQDQQALTVQQLSARTMEL